MNRSFFYLTISVFLLLSASVNSFADQKIKQRTTMQGQTFETTVMIKGSRQRSESKMGGEAGEFMPKVATVTQCDMRRTLQINDAQKIYFVQSLVEELPENSSVSNTNSKASSNEKTERGGIVTMTYTVTDTGERKQLFGLTARHIKTVMMTEPSPDACQKDKMRMETDGWYVDLAGFSCPLERPQMPAMAQSGNGGCQDKMRYKTSGTSSKLGFPLNVTTTIFDKNGKPQMTMTTETLELSNATLEAALFDIPSGYKQTVSAQELYKFDPAAMMRQRDNGDSDDNENNNNSQINRSNSNKNSNAANSKSIGTTRIGVMALTNKSGQIISVDDLRSYLIDNLTSGNVEAVAVNSVEDARSKSCDLMLSIDIAKLKQSAANKIGGLLGKATGVTAAKEKFETQIDFTLISVANSQTILQNKVSHKSEGSAETVVQTALNQAVQAVIDEAKRRK